MTGFSPRVRLLEDGLTELQQQQHVWHTDLRPRNVAHRGYSAIAPENTLAAYRRAAEAGFWGAETDIQLSADGYWVCIHDSTVNRTTNGTGPVASKTLAELKALDAGSWKSPEYAGEQIPTLEEYLFTCYVGGLVPYIEVKNGTYSDEQLAKIVATVVELGMERQAVVISFSLPILRRIRAMNDRIILGFVSGTMTESQLQEVRSLRNAFLDFGGIPTPEQMAMARNYGVSIEVWTVNQSSQALTCFERGVGAITTDTLSSIKELILS